MTYREIFELKFKKGLSTYELVRKFPAEIERVSKVALLDVPPNMLRKVLPAEKDFCDLMALKKTYLGRRKGKNSLARSKDPHLTKFLVA